MTRLLATLWCAVWRGHELVLDFTPDRIGLQCVHCPYRGKGWAVAFGKRA